MRSHVVMLSMVVLLLVSLGGGLVMAQQPAEAPVIVPVDKTVSTTESEFPETMRPGGAIVPERTSKIFSMQDVTLMALKNNLNVKINRINPHISETRVVTAESEFDPSLDVTLEGGENN